MKYFLTLIGLTIATIGQGQLDIKVGPSIGFGFSKMKHHDFTQFADSYNQYIQGNSAYQEDLKSPTTASAFSFGIQSIIGPAFVDWTYTKSNASSSVDFTYDQSRQFNFKRKEGNFYFGVGWAEDMVFFSLGAGLNLMSTSIESSYIYSNGVESFGEERVLNGVYDTRALKFSLGGRFGVMLKEVIGISAKVDYLFKGRPENQLAYYDFLEGTMNSGLYTWDRIPLNYDPNMVNLPSAETGVRSLRSDLRFSLSIAFFIGLGSL